jgi:hypothetical protein
MRKRRRLLRWRLKTRLVRLTYHDNAATAGANDETHFAFGREPEDTMAKRCGMVEGKDNPGVTGTRNLYSEMLVALLNGFAYASLSEPGDFRVKHAGTDSRLVLELVQFLA